MLEPPSIHRDQICFALLPMTVPEHPTLLLVDDEPDLLMSLEGLLRQKFQLHTAEDAEAALEIVDSQEIQVVMSDQRMPGMMGDALLAEISRRSPATIRILLTGYADIQDVIRALNTGGLFRYLTKPWDLDELLDVLNEAAELYRANQRQQARDEQSQRFIQQTMQFLETLPNSATQTALLEQGRGLSDSESVAS